jgi:hypothetical protein
MIHGQQNIKINKHICLQENIVYLSSDKTVVQGDQKVSVHLIITVQKTHKNILNKFNHLPR